MKIKDIIYLVCDISGYTKFINYHQSSLLHAELIINELLNAVINANRSPLIRHEILGDAIVFYAENDGSSHLAQIIYQQSEQFIQAFQDQKEFLRETYKNCYCEACRQLDKLQLKVVIHRGEAAFTRIRDIQKVSGATVICAHRLLKNSLKSKKYILMTKAFVQQLGLEKLKVWQSSLEYCDGLGYEKVYVNKLVPVGTRSSPFVRFLQQLGELQWPNFKTSLFY